jgi:hypothetical protein
MSLPDHIKTVLQQHNMPFDAVYKHGQSGRYLVRHWALEQIANEKGISFDPPEVLHLDPAAKTCVLLITGRSKKEEHWSFGESAPYNTKLNFPFAMAEARGKDRVILKFMNFKEDIGSEIETDNQSSEQHIDTSSLEAEFDG